MFLIGPFVGASALHASESVDTQVFALDFHTGPQGFVGDFADYPPAHAPIYELTSGHRRLPPPLASKAGLFLSGVNRSDDLFMFFKGPIGGLRPGALYSVTVSLEIATDTPAGCVGVGGAPGESVWIKAGVTAVEPRPILKGSYLRMNIDVGNQSNGGAQARVLGNIANSRRCEQSSEWELKSFSDRPMPEPIAVPADGRVWLLFGTDSGFESRTEIYFTRASVTFTPIGTSERGRCSEHFVTARAIRTRDQLPAFVHCAAEFSLTHGETEARRAFNEDARWKHGQVHLFVHGLASPEHHSVTHVFPLDPSREGTVPGQSIDEFGTDFSFEMHRILQLVDEGWIYYSSMNPTTGVRQLNSAYLMKIPWNGKQAAIGATLHSPDLPGSCAPEEVNAASVENAASDEALRVFVRCAAIRVEKLGYFAWPELTQDPRWKHGSIFVFGVNAKTGIVKFSGSESMFPMSGRIPELFGGRDMVRLSAEFGEAFWYYQGISTQTGDLEPSTVFVKLVRMWGLPLLVGSGYSRSGVRQSQ